MTRRRLIVVALGLVLLVAVALGIFWFGWDWKALIGWRALVDYIDPKNATGRRDALQVYALIVAGVVAAITAAVGLLNLRLTRKNLEQQRKHEAQRAEQQREITQGTALQAYYEQIGKLLTEYDLRNTKREEIRELARGQTLTVLQGGVDGTGKGSVLSFLHGAALIGTENPAVALTGAHLVGVNLPRANLPRANLQDANLYEASLYKANLREASLYKANLQGAHLREAHLQGANLQGANLYKASLAGANLQGANLQGAHLREAYLQDAHLQDAHLQGARVTDEQLANVQSLQGATMPDGSKHP